MHTIGTALPHYTHLHLPSSSDPEAKIVLCSHYMWIPDSSALGPDIFSLTCKYQNKIAIVTTVRVSDMKHLHSHPATSLFICARKLYVLIHTTGMPDTDAQNNGNSCQCPQSYLTHSTPQIFL
jgi:hypothetical protein